MKFTRLADQTDNGTAKKKKRKNYNKMLECQSDSSRQKVKLASKKKRQTKNNQQIHIAQWIGHLLFAIKTFHLCCFLNRGAQFAEETFYLLVFY